MTRAEFRDYLKLLSPVAPHICEELWQEAGFEGLCGESSWPNTTKPRQSNVVEMAVQVNGKVRSTITLPKDADEGEASAIALADEKIQRCTEGKKIVKTIYRPGRIFNIVVK